MDKFILAGIYSHMGDLSTAAGIKEHQITLCQFFRLTQVPVLYCSPDVRGSFRPFSL